MKRLTSFTVAICISIFSLAQPGKTPDDHFMKKSRGLKTAANITLAAGTVTLAAGIILLASTEAGLDRVDWDRAIGGIGLGAVGVSALTTSFFLFIASKQNEKKAHRVAFQVNKPVEINTGLFVKRLPYSIGISFPIR